MKKFLSIKILLLSLFFVCQPLYATASSSSTAITDAVDLYIQASKLDITSPKREGMLSKAVTLLEGHIAKNPNSMEAHRKLVGVLILQKHYSKAVKVMQDAITLSPEDPKLFIGLAFLYEHAGNMDFANHMLGQALKLDPANKMAKEYKEHIKSKLALLEQSDPHGASNPHAKTSPHKSSASPHGKSPHANMPTQQNQNSLIPSNLQKH